MKKVLLLAAIMAIGGEAWCSPYFRLLDISHPEPVAGGLIDTKDIKNTSIGSLLPLITHSPKDGCLLPEIVCEDWSPIAIGLSANAGKVTFDAGPLFNILPWIGTAARSMVPNSWGGVQAVLNSPPANSAVTFSGGPMFEYEQSTNKGYLKLFTGLALHF